MRFTVQSDPDHDVRMYLGVSEGAATPIFVVTHQAVVTEGETTFEVLLEHLPLPPKRFFLWYGTWETKTKVEVTPWQPIGPLILSGRKRMPPVPKAIVRLSPVYVHGHLVTHLSASATTRSSSSRSPRRRKIAAGARSTIPPWNRCWGTEKRMPAPSTNGRGTAAVHIIGDGEAAADAAIPLFKVTMAETAPDAVAAVLRSGYIGQGPKVEELEARLVDIVGTRSADDGQRRDLRPAPSRCT